NPRSSDVITSDLKQISNSLFSTGPLAYLTDKGFVIATFPPLGSATAAQLSGSAPVRETLQSNNSTSAPQLLGHQALAIGAAPVVTPKLVGVVVASVLFNDSYLNVRRVNEPDVHLAVVSRDGVLAKSA